MSSILFRHSEGTVYDEVNSLRVRNSPGYVSDSLSVPGDCGRIARDL